jgi:CRP/FNR family cyclic AMP-dependent transcriptional regulator
MDNARLNGTSVLWLARTGRGEAQPSYGVLTAINSETRRNGGDGVYTRGIQKVRMESRLKSGQAPMKAKARPSFDPKLFLAKIGEGRSVADYGKKQKVFLQGDPADAVFYVQNGRVKLTVVSKQGKEAVVAILGPGDFFGEGCMAGQPLRMATAIAMSECSIMRLAKAAMVQVLHGEPTFSELFLHHVLFRNIRIEEDLVDQLFNSSEKRLARVLLLLANFGKEDTTDLVVPQMSHEMLAEIIGTTRSRVSFFMNRFRKLGFIHYNGGLQVHRSLLNVVLHD